MPVPISPGGKMPCRAIHSNDSSKVSSCRARTRSARRDPSGACPSVAEAHREFLLVVMRVEFGPQIDVALGAAQRAEIFAHILRIRIARDHGRHHEGGVDDFAEAQLLDEIVGPAEQRSRRHLAVDQQLHAAEQQAVGKRQLDLVRLRYCSSAWMWRSGCRTGSRPRSARPRDRLACSPANSAARRCRTAKPNSIGVELAVAVGGGDVHRPMAGAADVAGAARFEGLIGADLVAEIDGRRPGMKRSLRELVIEPSAAK